MNFKESLERKRQAAKASPSEKPLSEMSEAELDAEERLRKAILEGRDYPGKAEDIALIKRKHRELTPERVRRVVQGGGRVGR